MRKHKADSEYLHYGCEISLSQLDNGFITACGFVSPLLNLVPFPSDFSNSLFRVIPVCIHTVQNDLLSSLDALPLPDYQKKYARLSETLEGEIKMNLQTYEKLRGESIRFGSFVYLQHSTSHKFLTISSNKTGVVERDSLQVVLSDFPNDYSCIKIEATYNFQKEGDGLIRINDIVVFEVFLNDLNKPAYISSSVKNMYKDYKKKFNSGKEINASFDKKTKWRIHLYDSVKQNDKKILSCGDCLWISHTEGKVILKALIENTEDVLFFQKNLSDANGLWKVESENDQVGGSVYTDKMYRLRHLNSGFYLTLAKEDSEEIYYGALGEKDDPSSLWTFESIYSWKKKFRVEMDQFFYIKNVETELKLQGIEDPYHFDGIKLEFTKDSSETSYFKIFKNDVTSLWETQFIIACVQIAKSYQEFLYEIKKLNVNESLAILKQFRKNSEIMNTCMEELDLFLQHMQKSSFSTGKNYGRVDKSRQKKFLELHMFDFLAEILDACFEGDMSLHKVFENKDEGRKNAVKMSKNTEISSVLLREVIKTVQIIYKVTGTACLDNSENQSYAYQFIYIYQKHAGYELGATKCITAILKNNDNLLGSLQKTIINFETGKATTTVIDHYTWLLRKFYKERKHYLVEFISSICCANNSGLTINQEKIHEKLFKNAETYSKAVIPTMLDSEKHIIYVVLQHYSGQGEENVDLFSCFSRGEIKKNYQKEIQYFIMILGLFANLCKGRNFICKSSITKWFPIQMLLENIRNEELSVELRAKFLEMLMNMHVDFQPRGKIKKPEMIKTVENIQKKKFEIIFTQRHAIYTENSNQEVFAKKKFLKNNARKKDIDDMYEEKLFKIEEEDGCIYPNEGEFPMFELKCKLIEYLNEFEMENFDVFLLQNLKLANLLVDFEVISTECSRVDDKYAVLDPFSWKFDAAQMDIIRLIKAACHILLLNTRLAKSTSVKESMSALVKESNSPRKEKGKIDKKKSKKKSYNIDFFTRFSEGLQYYLGYHIYRSNDNSESETINILCKFELCDLLQSGIDLRQDYLLNNVIAFYKENSNKLPLDLKTHLETFLPPVINSDKDTGKMCSLFKPAIEPLTNLKNNLIEELLFLFNSTKNYKLQTKILNIILRMYSQRKELIKNLNKITLLTLETDPDLLMHVKTKIVTFKNLVDQSEIVCRFWKQSHYDYEKTSENFENLISLLNDFENMMYTDEEERIPDNNRQIMLRHLDFHSYLVKFIKDNLHIYEEIDDEPKLPFEKKAKISLGQLFSQCFSSLKTFVKNNVKNQKLIYKHLDLLMANLQHNLGQIDLICEIFKDNMALCQEVDENLLKVFADLIVYEGRQARFLKFFETVIIVNNQPLASLQLKILSLLTSSPNSQILLFLDDNREFTFTSGLVSFEEFADEPYVYHAKLIDLLSKCAVVNANFQLAKSKCQKVIPVSMLLKLLRKQYEYTVLHTPLLKFFIRIFMDSNESLLEIENSSDFLEFISQQTKVLQGLNEKSQVSLDFYWQFLLLLDGLSEKISKFEHFVNIDTTIKLAIIAFHENWEFFISRNVPEEIVPALIRLGDHYSLLFKILPNVPKVEPSSKAEKKIVWQEILTVFNSAEFNKLAKEEQYHLISALSMISKVSSGVSQDFIIQGMLEYISLSLEYNPPIKILYAVIEFLGHSLNKPQKIGNETDEQAKERVQDQFRTFGVVKVILNLMCDKKLDSRIFYILVGLSNKLLSGGNEKIQFEFFEFFVTVQSSENFFRVIYKFIENFTSRIESISEVERKSSKFQKSSKLINSIIKLLQLLCENHNEILQNYIRDQERSRSNFDLVGSVILLLKELMRRKKSDDFNVISRCFEMLTECIQGPCKKNQKSIISSKFLEIANDLLSLDEKSDLSIPYSSLSSIYYNSNYGNEKLLEGWMVSHLKYKCIITLLALLEGQDDNYVVTRMVRAFNIQVFRENLISVYSLYIKLYPNRPYDSFLFGHFENSADSKSEKLVKHEEKSNEYYRVIIENGFMILHLMHYFAQADAPEITKVLMTEFPEIIENEKSSGLSAGIFEGIGSLSKGIFKAGAKVFRKISPADDIQKIQLSEAFEFFNRNTCNIEIVFKGVIFKTYFWLHPVCSYLTTEAKVDFHNKVDRTSEKSKINYLVSISDEMIEDMQYEQKLRKIYGYRIMASQVSTCKVLVFALTLYLNFLILSSYSAFNDQGDRLWSPSYGNIEIISLKAGDVDQTLKHLEAVGTVHTLFSGFIFLYFSIKTIPLFIQRVWNKEKEKLPNQETPAGAMGAFFKLTTTLKIFLLVLSNIDVVYQLAFFSFSVLAMRIHYFFFSVHLLDILYRFPSLQSVVQSIVLPWRSLVLTLMLIFIIVYLFSIWGYVKFFLYYAGNCDSLLMCFRTAFDQGLKNSGGVGMWLDYMEVGVSDAEIIPRFFYDDLFLIIIVIIMMNIVLGLIIDTFAVLREADEVNYADKENKCFICGMQKEEIERLSGRIFKYHTTKEHNEWNYLNFMAYLKFKENTEYSGIESYVYQLIEKKELDWIPQHQGLSFQRKNNEEANSAAKQLDEINAEIAELQQETNKFKRELMIEESRRTID